jgi:hypothetical protein
MLRCEIDCVSRPSSEKIIDLDDNNIVVEKFGSVGQIQGLCSTDDIKHDKDLLLRLDKIKCILIVPEVLAGI